MSEGIKFEVVVDDKGTPVIRRIGEETDKLGSRGKGLDALRGRFESLNNSFRGAMVGLQGLIAAAAAGAGMGAIVKEGIRFNASIEQTSVAFRVLLGDQKKSAELMQQIVAFAAQTPFQLEEVAAAEKTLVGARMEGLDYLRAAGDAASFASRPITEVALALARIKSGGFGEGFERLREMNIATRDMLEGKGLKFDSGGAYKGTAEDAIDAVVAIINERFGGMTQAQAQTWSGLMSTLKDSWAMFAGRLSAPLFERLKPKIAEAIAAFEKLSSSKAVAEWAEKLAKGAIDAIQAISEAVKSGVQFVTTYGELIGVVLRAVVAFAAIGVAIKVVTALLAVSPATLWIAGISLLLGIIWKVVDGLGGWAVAWEYMKAGAASAIDYVNAFLRVSWEAIKGLSSNWQATGRAIWETLKAAFMTAADVVVAYGKSVWGVIQDLGGQFRDLGRLIVSVLTFDRNKIAESWGAFAAHFRERISDIAGNFSGVGAGRWGEIGGLWGEALGSEFFARSASIMSEVDAKAAAMFAKADAARERDARAKDAAGGGGGAAPDSVESGTEGARSRAEEGGASLAEGILAASKDGFESWTEYFNAWVEETMSGIWGVVSGVADIIGSTVTDLFEAAIFEADSFGEATRDIFAAMKRAIVREIVDAAVSYGLNLLKMSLLRGAFEKKVTADVIANTAVRTAAIATETAAVNVQTGANVSNAAAEIFSAHAWIPFVGVGIAEGFIGQMLGVMGAIKGGALAAAGFWTGGLIPGGGAGVEDRTTIFASGGEYVMPRGAVQSYGTAFMDSVRTGAFRQEAPAQFNVSLAVGDSGLTEREVEEELVPVLERLALRRRTRLALSS